MSSIGDAFGTQAMPSANQPYSGFTTISDDSGQITLDVPVEWNEIDGRTYFDDQGNEVFDVTASGNLDGFFNTYDVPGVIVAASRDFAASGNELDLLQEFFDTLSQDCTYEETLAYDDGLYTGELDRFTNCGTSGAQAIVLGAVPSNRAFVIGVYVQAVEDRDVQAATRALDTFIASL